MTEELSKLKLAKKKITPEGPKSRGRLLRVIAALAAAGLIIILFLSGAFSPGRKVDATTVSLMYPSQAFTLLNASGYVVAQRKAGVASKVTGRVISISVEEGSRVKAGEILARLESEDVSAARSQAEANLNTARHNLEQAKAELEDADLQFKRNKELLDRGFLSRAEYDTSKARLDKAKAAVDSGNAQVKAASAALEIANASVNYTLIRAPFDGIVLTKNADVGDIVTPIGAAAQAKASVVTMADMDSLQVEADVSESNLGQVKLGQPAEIQLDAFPDSRFPGVVHMIVPTADRTKASVLVKVRFLKKDPRTLPEMSAKVAFLSRAVRPEEEKPRTVVSSASIVNRKGKQVLFVIANNRVQAVEVRTGERMGDMTEVLSGAKLGDKVVAKPADNLRSGDKVKIAEK